MIELDYSEKEFLSKQKKPFWIQKILSGKL